MDRNKINVEMSAMTVLIDKNIFYEIAMKRLKLIVKIEVDGIKKNLLS